MGCASGVNPLVCRLMSVGGPGPSFEIFLTVSPAVVPGGGIEVRNAAMPYGINAVGLKQRLQALQLIICDKSHRNARPPHPPGPSCPVRIGFSAERIIVINHMTHMAEVESSAGNVRSNHESNLIPAKTLKNRYSSRLFQPSMDISYRFKFSLQLFGQFLAVMP